MEYRDIIIQTVLNNTRITLKLYQQSRAPCAVTFSWWGIVYVDPDSYAGWSFILLVEPPKSDMLQDRGQTK